MENEEARAKSHPPVEQEFDSLRLAQLGRRIVGERTVQDFCEERGLSRSLVSRILNGTLKAPPRIRSLYRFAGEDTTIADEMLLACGYPVGVVDHLKKLPGLLKTADEQMSVDICMPNLAENPASALALVLDALVCRGYGDRFQVDYSRDGTFTVQLESGCNLIAIPAFSTNENQVDAVWSSALQRMGLAILRNGEGDKNVYIFVTNDDRLYGRIVCIPNTGFLISVLKIGNGEIEKQQVVAKSGATEEEKKAFASSFPILLKKADLC